MGTSTEDESERSWEDNSSLFRERMRLQDELERLGELVGANASARRRTRLLRRRFDEVTSRIISQNIGLVRSYTRRFNGMASAEDRCDFESAGLVGLVEAVDSYDPSCGTFGQWAFRPIRRAVLRAVRDANHPNLNYADFEGRPAILKARIRLQSLDEGCEPTDAEIAAAASVSVAQVRRVLSPFQLESMTEPTSCRGKVELSDTIAKTGPSPESAAISKLTRSNIRDHGLAALDPRELYVIVRRFGLDDQPVEKLAKIAAVLALSRERVRQIELRALAKLQHPIVLYKLRCHDAPTHVSLVPG